MVRAYILIECATSKAVAVAEALVRLEGVVRAEVIIGQYSVILLAEKPDAKAIGNFVTGPVQKIPGVERTTTCLSVRL